MDISKIEVLDESHIDFDKDTNAIQIIEDSSALEAFLVTLQRKEEAAVKILEIRNEFLRLFSWLFISLIFIFAAIVFYIELNKFIGV